MPAKDNISGADGVDQLGAHAAAEDEAPTTGDLVELHDGAYAIVLDTVPVTVLRIGLPELHELPVRKVA